MMLIIFILFIIFIAIFLTNNTYKENYTDVTKRYPPYFYYFNPYYLENQNDVPYKYFYYKYPKDDNLNYYLPDTYNTGYFKQKP